MSFVEIFGVAIFSLVFSCSRTFQGGRGWLLGFRHPMSPPRLVGRLVSSPLVLGAIFGACYSFSLVYAGLCGGAAWILSVVYQVVEVQLERTRGHGMIPVDAQVRAEVFKLLKEKEESDGV